MNKKQLAKLLIKHPEIKALYESREFDASTINKIVAEEIMREDEDEEGEGRVSKAANQTRATLDAAEDNELRPVNCKKDDICWLKQEIEAAKTEAELKELAKDVEDLDPGHQGLLNALEAAKARIEGGGSEAPSAEEEDPARKQLIKSMKSEIEIFRSLLSDPDEMPLDKKEYKEAIDEYIEKLEKMGVEVATSPSIKDDKAFVKSVTDSKPEIEKAADAVKAAGDDGFAETFPDLDAAIMASLKGSKDAATAANPELELSDIENEDVEDAVIEEPATEEGTAAAVEAIENEVPVEVVNIQPADAEAAKEELKPEIEKDPQKEARAEELTNKVENKKMADKSKAVSSWRNFNNKLKQSNVENKKKLLDAEVKKRLKIYSKAQNWGDLAKDPLNHEISNDATDQSFEKWKTEDLPKIEDYFNGVLERLPDKKIEELEPTTDDIGTQIGTIDDAMNNVADDKDISGDSSGADIAAKTDLEAIREILPELKDKFPNLFKFDGFVKNLAQALMNTEPSLDSDGEEGELVDATGTANSSDTSLDSNKVNNSVLSIADSGGLEESLSGIYLTEEGEAVPPQVDNTADDTTGQPLDVADATVLQAELEELRKILEPMEINVEDLLTQDLKDALAKAPETDVDKTPSVEEAKEEGQSAAQDDAESEDARYQDLYIGFKEQMDTFFSLDGKNDGFMDQFLLKYQGAKLAALIGNLDLIIGGGTKGQDDEDEARALSTATQQADNNLNEEQGQEISEKGQLELKTRLVAMLKGLKSLKAMMNSYKQYATRSSANPKLDGSALKKSLQRYMSNLQINIKAIVETCYIEHSRLTQTQSDDVNLNEPSGDKPTQPTADDTPPTVEPPQDPQNEQLYEAILEAIAPALEGVSLMEDAAREEKMELVNTIYGQMKEEIYLPSMQSALEKSQKETAMKNASQMMEFAKKEEFVALFPTFTGTFGGKPQTIDGATDAIDGLLRDFIETMKKVIVLAKGATIDETTLSKVIEDLSMMSLMMQNYFGVKSLLDDDMQAKVEKMLAQREENQSLSDDAKPSTERSSGGIVDKAKDLVGKGLEKLKQMFSWMSEESLKLLAKLIDAPDIAKDPMFIKFVEPFGELVVKQGGELTAKSEGSPEVKQVEELMVKTLESKSWFDSLKPEQQSIVTVLVERIYKDKRMLQEIDSARLGNVPFLLGDQISADYKTALLVVFNDFDNEEKELLSSMMLEDEDEFVSYLVNQHELRRKMGEEKAKQIGDLVLKTTDSSQRSASNEPMSAEAEYEDDEDPNAEDETPKPPGDLDKDNSEFEDEELPGMDDPDKETDKTGSPEDEDDIADFNREVQSVDEFLPFPSRQTIPIAKEIQPIKTSFVTLLGKKKKTTAPIANALFNKFFLLIFKQMNKDLVMESDVSTSFNIPKIKQDVKTFITSLKSDDLRLKDFQLFFENIETEELVKLLSLIKKHKQQIAKAIYGGNGVANQTNQDNSEKAVRGKEVNLEEALRPIIEKMLNEHYNH